MENLSKNLSLIVLFVLVTSCSSNNSFENIESLEQKVLEIPPNFDLKPPLEEEKESLDDVLNKRKNTSNKSNELEEILGIEDNSVDTNNAMDDEILDVLTSDSEIATE